MVEIMKQGAKSLSSVASSVNTGDDVSRLVSDMWSTMYENKGIGLAANQVGSPYRVFVMHANGLKQEFINPVITKRYGGKISNKEGCLSFPGMLVSVVRDKQIVIEGFDSDWRPIKRKLKGLAACCAQHELDHLNGVTIA